MGFRDGCSRSQATYRAPCSCRKIASRPFELAQESPPGFTFHVSRFTFHLSLAREVFPGPWNRLGIPPGLGLWNQFVIPAGLGPWNQLPLFQRAAFFTDPKSTR